MYLRNYFCLRSLNIFLFTARFLSFPFPPPHPEFQWLSWVIFFPIRFAEFQSLNRLSLWSPISLVKTVRNTPDYRIRSRQFYFIIVSVAPWNWPMSSGSRILKRFPCTVKKYRFGLLEDVNNIIPHPPV